MLLISFLWFQIEISFKFHLIRFFANRCKIQLWIPIDRLSQNRPLKYPNVCFILKRFKFQFICIVCMMKAPHYGVIFSKFLIPKTFNSFSFRWLLRYCYFEKYLKEKFAETRKKDTFKWFQKWLLESKIFFSWHDQHLFYEKLKYMKCLIIWT